MKSIIKNLSLNGSDFLISFLFTVIVSFLITNNFGDEAFGLYSIFFSVISALMLFDFGMSNVLVRLMLEKHVDKKKKSLYLASAYQIFLFVFCIVFIIVFFFFDISDKIGLARKQQLLIKFLLLLNVISGVFCNIYSSYYISLERWNKIWKFNQFYKVVVIAGILVFTVVCDEFDIVIIISIFTFSAILKAMFMIVNLYNKVSFRYIVMVNGEYLPVIKLAKHTALNFISGFAVNHADKFLLAAILTPKQFGYYAFSTQISNSLYNGINVIPKTIYPRSIKIKEMLGSALGVNIKMLFVSFAFLCLLSIVVLFSWQSVSLFFYNVSFSNGVYEILPWAMFLMICRSLESVSFYYSLLVKKPYLFSYATLASALIFLFYIYAFISSEQYVWIFILKSIITIIFYSLTFYFCYKEDVK